MAAQKPIRVLDAIKWDPRVEEHFFKHKFKKLPHIDAAYYQENNRYNLILSKKSKNFVRLSARCVASSVNTVASAALCSVCVASTVGVVEMLVARGTPKFTEISQELYGSTDDAFHVGAPTLKDLATLVSTTLANIKDQVSTEADTEMYTSEQTVEILRERLGDYFTDKTDLRVELSDGILADASAGADRIKIHDGLTFSEREIRVFEVHEGWGASGHDVKWFGATGMYFFK